jgi:glutaredoxin
MALEFLRQNGIQHTNYNVRQDAAARQRMIKINRSGSVPTALINGKKVVGFSEKKYRELLDK